MRRARTLLGSASGSWLPQVMKMGEVASADAEWKRKTDILNGFLSPALEIYFAKAGISPFEVKND